MSAADRSSSNLAPPPKYKVLSLEDGVLTLGEDGVDETGDDRSVPPPGGDASESSTGVSGVFAPQAAQSVSIGAAAAAAADRAEGAGAGGNWGQRGGEVGHDGDAPGGAEDVFDGELSDGEADAIAGGSFMAFSNDMRVSI